MSDPASPTDRTHKFSFKQKSSNNFLSFHDISQVVPQRDKFFRKLPSKTIINKVRFVIMCVCVCVCVCVRACVRACVCVLSQHIFM